MPVAAVKKKEKQKNNQPTIKQTNKQILSIKSHSFPTFNFLFILFTFFLTFYFSPFIIVIIIVIKVVIIK